MTQPKDPAELFGTFLQMPQQLFSQFMPGQEGGPAVGDDQTSASCLLPQPSRI